MNTSTARIPVVNAAHCKKFGKCVEICPRQAIAEPTNSTCSRCIKYCISLEVPCSPEHVVIMYDLCDSCGRCIEECPHDAIVWITPKVR